MFSCGHGMSPRHIWSQSLLVTAPDPWTKMRKDVQSAFCTSTNMIQYADSTKMYQNTSYLATVADPVGSLECWVWTTELRWLLFEGSGGAVSGCCFIALDAVSCDPCHLWTYGCWQHSNKGIMYPITPAWARTAPYCAIPSCPMSGCHVV